MLHLLKGFNENISYTFAGKRDLNNF